MDDHSTSNWSLPEPIIHKIFSFLPPQDAIRASATSKPWRSAWISCPFFAFDEKIVPFKLSDFYDYANRSLALWRDRCDTRVNMEELSLCADVNNGETFSRFVELVAIATSRNVKVIKLKSFAEYFFTILYNDRLWSLLSDCKSLEVLSLNCLKPYFPSSIPVISSVRKLSLVCVLIDGNSFRNMISSLPLLEDLDVELCTGFTELRVSSSKLETMKVSVWDNVAQKYVVDAVNLRSFLFHRAFSSPGKVSFANCNSLTSLEIESTRFDTVNEIDEFLSQIPLLENLTLRACPIEEGIQISHSNLKSLNLFNCWRLRKANINTPNLQFFKCQGGIFHVSRFIYCSGGLLNAQLKLFPGSIDGTEWFWFVRLRNFLESFSKCEVLSLTCCLEGFPEELRDYDMLPDPFYELTHLNISGFRLPIAHYASFVDSLVELFPCAETLFLKTPDVEISIEFDEDRYFELNWKATIHASTSDEYDRKYQSIEEATDKIMQLLSWTEEDSNENESSASESSEVNVDVI